MSDLTELSDLYEATRAIGLADSLDTLIDNVLERSQALIGFEHCALMLYDGETETLTLRRARGYGDRKDDILGLILEMGHGISGWAAEHREAVRVGDVREDPRYVQGLEEARSNMAVPLVVGNELAGVINVESDRVDAFTEEHEELLTILGAQTALAILAARARRRLESQLRQLDALFRISRLASQERELDQTLQRILTITQEIVPEGQVAILLRDESDNLRVRAAKGYIEGVEDLVIRQGQGVTGTAAEEGRTVVVDDVDDFPSYIRGVPEGRSEIAVPLKVEGEVIGVLDAEATEAYAFGQEQQQTLSVVAQQVAAVLHTVRLHEETRQLAITDSLTGLHNRRYFINYLEDHLSRADRYGEKLALLLLDCDELKEINDRFGHHFGDEALASLARRLEESVRESDQTGRLGGDEFAILLLNAGRELTLTIVERLLKEVAELELETDGPDTIDVTVSVGVALFPEHGRESKELIRKADEALYRAKRRGRNRFILYSESESDASRPGAAQELTGGA